VPAREPIDGFTMTEVFSLTTMSWNILSAAAMVVTLPPRGTGTPLYGIF